MRRRLLPIVVLYCLALLILPLRALLAGSLFLPLTLSEASGVPTLPSEPTIASAHIIEGTVYDAGRGIRAPIAGARVTVLDCVQERDTVWSTSADADGRYRLSLPRPQLDVCNWVLLQVTADGYQSVLQSVSVATLYAQPERNVGLHPAQVQPTVPATVQATLPAPVPTVAIEAMVLAGRIYDAGAGPGGGILGAAVQVQSEGSQLPLTAATDRQGDYTLVVPEDYCPDCRALIIRVVALGYESHSESVPLATLREQPLRDYALTSRDAQAMWAWERER